MFCCCCSFSLFQQCKTIRAAFTLQLPTATALYFFFTQTSHTEGVDLVWFLHQATICSRDSSGHPCPVLFCQPLTCWQKQLSLPCCLFVGAPNLAASQLSRMKCPIKRYEAGRVGTPVSSQMFAGLTVSMWLCIFIGVCLGFVLTVTSSAWMCSVYASTYPSKQSFVYLSIHLSIHHCYLMRWHLTSRFIGCVQTNPDLIRPHHWKSLPSLHWFHSIMTHLHLTM